MGFDLGSTLMGGLSGAATGFAMSGGNPIGAGAGFLAGGGLAAYSSHKRSQGANSRRTATDEAMRRLQMLSQQQYARRMEDVNKAMSFYEPARQAMARYSEPVPQMWGPNGQPPPKVG
jgi:hypothetical protein